MKSRLCRTAAPLITKIQKLFSKDLAKENDFLRQENKILRSKLGRRVPLTESDRRTLDRYHMKRGRVRGEGLARSLKRAWAQAAPWRVVKIFICRILLPAFGLGVSPFALLISAHALEKTAGLGYWTNRRNLAPETRIRA
jgi:hypothetical protein